MDAAANEKRLKAGFYSSDKAISGSEWWAVKKIDDEWNMAAARKGSDNAGVITGNWHPLDMHTLNSLAINSRVRFG